MELLPDVISSEESDIENDGVIIITPLVWHSQRVSEILITQDNSKRVGKHGGSKENVLLGPAHRHVPCQIVFPSGQ